MAFFVATTANNVFLGTLADLNDTVSYALLSSTIPLTGVQVNLSLAGPQLTLGSGSDSFFSIENLIGSSFNDILFGNTSNNIIQGGAGNDFLDGGAGNDTASYASAGAGVSVSLNLAGAQNTIGAGIDTLVNFENLTGSNFNDTLIGNGSNNIIEGGGGSDFLDGGAGIDTASYASAGAGVTVSLSLAGAQNTIGAGVDTLVNFENLTGSSFNDTLSGNAGINVLDGGAGIDTVSYANATAGVTVSLSLTGAQTTIGAGNDTLLNFENLTGSNFIDTLSGNVGNNVLNGGLGVDTVSYANATAGVTVSLGLTTAQNTIGAGVDTLLNFENLTGSNFNDTLSGNAGNNALNGGAGIDTISYANATAGVTVSLGVTIAQNTFGAGNDTLLNFENLTGSNFNDTLSGNAGSNVLNGGLGIDLVSYANATAAVTVSLGLTTAQNTFGAGVDTLLNFENLTGSAFGDSLSGNALNNVIDGGAGDDRLDGGAGNDTLIGGAGSDALIGGDGSDLIIGGLGQDRLSGGSGNDIFQFNSVSESPSSLPDVITDFNRLLGDRIDVSVIDANIASASNQAFAWVGLVSGGSIGRGELGYQISGSDLILLGNTGTSAVNPLVTPDFRVLLLGAASSGLTAANVNL
jgi:Ca2+-binding RTX toxin-like protein